MGKYNGAIVTTVGQNLIANAVASNQKVIFTKLKASTHVYASTTDFEAMTSIADIVQSVDISYAGVYNNNVIQVSGRFTNNGVVTPFTINTIGLYGKVGSGNETLVAVVTAVNADTMPVADPVSPTAIVYNIQMTVQNSGVMEVEVNDAGTINVHQFNDALYSTAAITVPTTGWTASGSQYTKTIDVGGITSSSMPFVELQYPDNVTATQKKAIDKAASKLVSLTTTNYGQVVLTATEVPATSFNLLLRGLGSGQYTQPYNEFFTTVLDKEPYVSRTARDGLVKIPQIVGGTVAWNQLVDSDTESVTIPTGRKYILYHDGTYTLGTSDGTAVSVSSGDMFFDITIMFGTTVTNAMTTTLFATMFPKTDYAYDAGSLQSVCTNGRKITALDGTVRTYPIDNEELRGLFKLDANNKLYADGDIYPSSGSGMRKYGLLTEQSGAIGDTISLTGAKEDTTNIISTKGALSDIGTISGTTLTLTVALSDDSILYELAEPTTFTADPYINPQRSEGTEEFVDGLTRDVMIPVGNESTYYLSEVLPSAADYTDGQVSNMSEDITGLQGDLADTNNMIAPAWSATATYTKNSIVRDGGQLYKAKSDVPTGTATSNTTYWSSEVLVSDIRNLNNVTENVNILRLPVSNSNVTYRIKVEGLDNYNSVLAFAGKELVLLNVNYLDAPFETKITENSPFTAVTNTEGKSRQFEVTVQYYKRVTLISWLPLSYEVL